MEIKSKPTKKYIDHALLLPACGHSKPDNPVTEADLNLAVTEMIEFSQLRLELFRHVSTQAALQDITFNSNQFELKAAYCRPLLFNVAKPVFSCRLPNICPWCFTKYRVIPALDDILKVIIRASDEQRDKLALIGYYAVKREYNTTTGELTLHPAFDKRYGYHKHLKSHITKCFFQPSIYTENDREHLGTYNFGLSLFDKSSDYAAIALKSRFKGLTVLKYAEDLDKTNVYKLAATVFSKMKWRDLYTLRDSGFLLDLYKTRNCNQKHVRTHITKADAADDTD